MIASFGGDVYSLAISHSAAAMKSSNTFCFFVLLAGLVPVFAVLAAAAQVRDREDAAHAPARRRPPAQKTGVSEMLKPP